ncbi:MAG TPA: GNAT family N-acetyltransferase [Terriglobales bacterium]|nr:GNAT family N-acetyltransferase [Terriglobales bacterium]
MTDTPATNPLCSYLEWDSGFFDRRIGRLNAPRLDDAIVAEALQWCGENRIDCLYFLADPDHAETCRLAESNRFQLVDVRLTYERDVEQTAAREGGNIVRFAREDDLQTLRAIARVSHYDSRFYFDSHFGRAKCDLFYETWIENSFRGFAQAVLVAEGDGAPAAYLTCHYKDRESQIGLVGVSRDHQGRGLGSALVSSFLAWSQQQGASRARVVTQGRNVGAQRLYERTGFLLSAQQLWYHRWFPR